MKPLFTDTQDRNRFPVCNTQEAIKNGGSEVAGL